MRILHVTPFYEPAWAYGGMARASGALCRALAGRGHDVAVATVRLHPSHPEEEVLGGVRVRRLPSPRALSKALVPWAPGLRPLLLRGGASSDVVHVHGHRSGLAWAAARALHALGRPFVLQPHGTYPHHGQHRLGKRVFDLVGGRRIVARAAALVAVSSAEARDLPGPACVVPNGVEPVESDVAGETIAGRLLFVGSDRPQKRSLALVGLLDRLPDVSLDLVGPFRAGSLAAFGRQAGRVRALGVLSGADLARAYRAAALVVHPAVGEAFGLVPFEAALVGTASVVAGGHGCGEWYTKAGGCVVPPDDPGPLAEAVRTRLADPTLAAGEAGRVADFAGRELTWDRAAREMEGLYEAVRAAGRA